MIPELEITFLKNSEKQDGFISFEVNASCSCCWLEGGDEIIVFVDKDHKSLKGRAIQISFNFMKSLDPDGGHEWLSNKLKKLIIFLVKNKDNFF